MTPTDLGLLTLSVLAWVGVGLAFLVARRFHRDEIFAGVAPGIVPAHHDRAPRERVKGAGQEYDGEIAVAFSPPKGFRPGLVGTVIDGRVDSRDLTATLVDLAVRGHVKIVAVPAEGPPSRARSDFARRPDAATEAATDWLLARNPEHAYDVLDPWEAALLDGLFHGQSSLRMSQLDHASLQAMREAQVGLYRQVVDKGWYPRHPQQRSAALGCLFIGLGLVLGVGFIAVRQSWVGILSGVLVLGAAVVLTRALRGRTARTALGTAVRVQALGFKKYLATAEADQFKFEEAAGIFSRYLPYAMVFGVAQHWSKVFGDVARRAEAAGFGADVLNPDLTWFVIPDGSFDLGDLLFLDSLDGNLDLFGAGDVLVQLGGGAVEGLGDFATQVGEFMGSLDFLDGLGDGCGDGCGDLGGCIDF